MATGGTFTLSWGTKEEIIDSQMISTELLSALSRISGGHSFDVSSDATFELVPQFLGIGGVSSVDQIQVLGKPVSATGFINTVKVKFNDKSAADRTPFRYRLVSFSVDDQNIWTLKDIATIHSFSSKTEEDYFVSHDDGSPLKIKDM